MKVQSVTTVECFFYLFMVSTNLNFAGFHSRTVHPDIIKSFIYPTECTITLKCTLKCSYVFRLTNHDQGTYCCALLKLCLLK